MEKGKLPITGRIVLESNEDQWRLKVNGLINELKISGVIEKEPGMKVRVNITLSEIISPERLKFTDDMIFQSNLEQVFVGGTYRTFSFLYNFFHKSTWIFLGYIDGNEKIPVMILHIHDIGISIYTQKLKSEQLKIFHPRFPQMN